MSEYANGKWQWLLEFRRPHFQATPNRETWKLWTALGGSEKTIWANHSASTYWFGEIRRNKKSESVLEAWLEGPDQRWQALAFSVGSSGFQVSYLQLGSACAVQTSVPVLPGGVPCSRISQRRTQRLDRLAWPAMVGGSTVETFDKSPKKSSWDHVAFKKVQKNWWISWLQLRNFPSLKAFFSQCHGDGTGEPLLSQFGCGDPSALWHKSADPSGRSCPPPFPRVWWENPPQAASQDRRKHLP